MKEFQSFDRKHVTDKHKKVRKVFLLLPIVLGGILFHFLYRASGKEDYGLFLVITQLGLTIMVIIYIIDFVHKRIYPENVNSEVYCTTVVTFLTQAIAIGLFFLWSIAAFVNVLHIIQETFSINNLIFLIESIIVIVITLWGFYKITQKKLCEEFPEEWLTKEKPSLED